MYFVGPPSITNFWTTRQVDEGGSLDLRCETQLPKLQRINQTVSFQWASYGQDAKDVFLVDRMTTTVHQDPNRLNFFYDTLRLSPVSRSDSGSYTCRIRSSVGTSKYSSDSVSVNVKCNVITHCHILILIHRVHFYFSCTGKRCFASTFSGSEGKISDVHVYS